MSLPVFFLCLRREEAIPLKSMLEPEDEKIGKGGAGIVDLIGDYVERKSKGEAPGPGAADEGKAEYPEDGRQFIRV